MAWKTIYGRSGQFEIERNGKNFRVSLPKTRVFDPKIGRFVAKLNIDKADFVVETVEGGYLGVWRLGPRIFVIWKQPGHSQAVGAGMNLDGGKWVISNAQSVATNEEHKTPTEVLKLLE